MNALIIFIVIINLLSRPFVFSLTTNESTNFDNNNNNNMYNGWNALGWIYFIIVIILPLLILFLIIFSLIVCFKRQCQLYDHLSNRENT